MNSFFFFFIEIIKKRGVVIFLSRFWLVGDIIVDTISIAEVIILLLYGLILKEVIGNQKFRQKSRVQFVFIVIYPLGFTFSLY